MTQYVKIHYYSLKCLQSNFAVVKHVAHYGVYHGKTKSILGANVQPYIVSVLVLQWMHCSKTVVHQTIDDTCNTRFTSEYYIHALATVELLMVTHGALDVYG